QLRKEECAGNSYKINGSIADLKSRFATLQLRFPSGAKLSMADAKDWNEGWEILRGSAADKFPILTGSVGLEERSCYIGIHRVLPDEHLPIQQSPDGAFAGRSRQLANLASSVRFTTPDPYIDASIAALTIAADALWDARQQCVMHGAVAWRNPLAGWRGPYALDALGNHQRMKQQVRHWIAKQ